jgi:hypothetical protein
MERASRWLAVKRSTNMHYDFIAIPDTDVPQAVEPVFQHVVTTYASKGEVVRASRQRVVTVAPYPCQRDRR